MEEQKTLWNKLKQNQKEIQVHLMVWFIYVLCIIVWYDIPFTIIDIFDTFLTAFMWMITFYGYHLVILPYFFRTRKWLLLIFVYFILHIIYVLAFYGEEMMIAHIQENAMTLDIEDVIRRGSFWHTQFILIALGYHFYGESVREKQKVLIEEQKRLLIETELQATQLKLRDAELENLKAQLNPHFLFNVIWYIIVLIQDTGNQKAVRAMQILHDMMRYSMNSRTVAELVPLKEELKYAKDFIDLQILRTPVMKLDYQVVEEEIEGIKILPLVLISFIENSIKHGKLNEEENPLMIHLTVEKNKNFTFFVKNKISASGQAWSSGIGLENVTSRLKRAYGDKHSLIIDNDGTFYTTKLTIEV
jgi:two-component system, LytTR family, sensor kinase